MEKVEINKNGEKVYRGYRINSLGTFALYKIQGPGSGPVPNELTGHFTDVRSAIIAIDHSMNKLKGRGRSKNAKETSTSSS